MQPRPPITYETCYHLYNRGVNSCALFKQDQDFEHFLWLYDIFVKPIADTYAWCLMSNHVHFMVRIKEEPVIGFLNPRNARVSALDKKWQILTPSELETYPDKSKLKKPIPIRMIGHLFNAYAKWFNLKYDRTGRLFEESVERIPVENDWYFRNLLIYILRNPVYHGVVDKVSSYPWVSYHEMRSEGPSRICRNEIVERFGGVDEFEHALEKLDLDGLEDYMLE